MNAISEFLRSDSCRQLVMTLLHSLWQGAALAALLWTLLRSLPAKAANKRYAASLIALVALPVVMACTWSILHAPKTRDNATAAPAAIAPAPSPSMSAVSVPHVGVPFNEPSKSSATNWPAIVALVWLAGASLMLLRAATSVAGAHRLLRQCEPVRDPAVLAALDEVCRRLDLNRRVRILVGKVSSPAAIGLIWPAILLPGDLLGGLPPGQLRLILAHELAHIRRYDYLVNVLQLILESLLFFNPVVWWISRHVRREREAACDALAVRLTGEPDEYARLLLVEAMRVRNAALVSFSGGIEKPLSERVRRLLSDAYHPHAALPIFTFLGALALSLLCLALLCVGTSWAVTEALTPQQRFQELDEARKAHPPYHTSPFDNGENERVRVAGIVTTEDGVPLAAQTNVLVSSTIVGARTGAGVKLVNREFSASVRPGNISLVVDVEGYALASVGPRLIAPNQEWTDIRIVLHRGLNGRVSITDAADHRIRGAKVYASQWFESASPRKWQLESDEQGAVNLEHASEDLSVRLSVLAPGYQHETVIRKLRADQTLGIPLKAAAPTEGAVMDRETGRPVPNAEVYVMGPIEPIPYPIEALPGRLPPEAAIHLDTQGRFALTSLRDDTNYSLFVRAEGHAPTFVRDVHAGMKDFRVALGPPIYVTGRVVGSLGSLPLYRGIPQITYDQEFSVPGLHSGLYGGVPLDVRDGVGHFEIHGLWAGPFKITAGSRTTQLALSQSLDGVVIDLGPTEASRPMTERPLLIRLLTPPEAPPKGVGWIFASRGQTTGPEFSDEIHFKGSEARLQVPAPSRLTLTSDGLIGYWFEAMTKDCPAAGGELVWEVPVHPAGAFIGRVLDADGEPASGMAVEPVMIRPPANAKVLPKTLTAFTGADGGCMVTPIVYGVPYVLVASKDAQFVISDEVTLDERKPLSEIVLKLSRGKSLKGIVLFPDGKPVELITVQLVLDDPSGLFHDVQSDRFGHFEIKGINPDVPGKYAIQVRPPRGYKRSRSPISLDGREQILRLEPGETLKGEVIDADTGEPIPALRVYAERPREWVGAEEYTNNRGEFEFTRLDKLQYTLGVMEAGAVEKVSAIGGQAEPVIIKVRRNK